MNARNAGAVVAKALGAVIVVAGSLEVADLFVTVDQYAIIVATALTAGVVYLVPNALTAKQRAYTHRQFKLGVETGRAIADTAHAALRHPAALPGDVNLKGGRRKPKNAPAIEARRFLRMDVAVENTLNDYAAKLRGWQMLGNDSAGDCVAVTWANFRRLVTALLTNKENYPTIEQVWAIYKLQNPGFDPNGSATTNGPGSEHDGGMDIQTLLEYLVKTGGPDGVKALAFAKLNGLAEIRQAQAILGGVWLGINVTAANMTEFNDGDSWDYVKSSAPDGGHSVLGAGNLGKPGGDIRFITWAEETDFTEAFEAHQIEEAWAVIWPEHLGTESFMAGVDLQALASAYTEITGAPFPVAVVPPTPSPIPSVNADTALAAVARKALKRHAFANTVVGEELSVWLAARGL